MAHKNEVVMPYEEEQLHKKEINKNLKLTYKRDISQPPPPSSST